MQMLLNIILSRVTLEFLGFQERRVILDPKDQWYGNFYCDSKILNRDWGWGNGFFCLTYPLLGGGRSATSVIFEIVSLL